VKSRPSFALFFGLALLLVLGALAGCAPPAPAPAPVCPTAAPAAECPSAPICPTCPTAAPAPTAEPVAVATVEPGKYYFLAANNADPFYTAGNKGKDDACAALNISCEFVGPMDLNLAAQMKTFEELVADPETKGIFLYFIDPNAAEPQIQAAVDKGIPVIVGGGDSPFKTRTGFVGYDNTILGGQAGDWAAKLVNCQGPVGSIHVVSAYVGIRVDAFEARLKERCPDIEIIPTVTHDGTVQNAAVTLDAYTASHPDATLIWFADGGSGQQAQNWKDKQAAGLTTKFLATDMPDATLQAVKDGIFIGSVGQDTYTEEYTGFNFLYQAAHGKRVPDTSYLSAILVDKDNVDQFLSK
jgi:ribose transport system substrate-binding protein